MELFGRQLAWLNSPIDPKNEASQTRLEARQSKAAPLNLPAVEAAHLLDVLNSAGWFMSGGLRLSPITAGELLAWMTGMQHRLDPWEFDAVRAASRAYCAQAATDDPREPNFQADDRPLSPIRAMAAALNKPKDTTS